MATDANELYKAVLMKHGREPRNRGQLDSATHQAKLTNSLCGDEVTVYLKIQDNQIAAAAFEAQCCSICMASASMLTDKVLNQSTDETRTLSASLIANLKSDSAPSPLEPGDELHSLNGVKAFASRIRCATLPWEALSQAVDAAKAS